MDVYSFVALLLKWLFASFVAGLIIFTWLLIKKYDYWRKRGIPYEKPFMFFGNLSFLMRESVTEFCIKIKNKYPGDYVGLYLGWKPALMVQTPELAKAVLVKETEHFEDRSIYTGHSDPLGSMNLFTLKNPAWTHMRNALSPMFTSSRLKSVTELMNINAQQLVRKVQRDYVEKKNKVNLKELFSMYTSDTVAYTVFGLRTSALSDENSPLWVITVHMVKWTFYRGLELTMIFLLPALAKLFRLKFFSDQASEYIKNLFWSVVDERNKNVKVNDKDLVCHLLRLKENLKIPSELGLGELTKEDTNNLMLAQVAVFILGSIDTSSTTLSYCLHELAHHPDEQEKLYEEINDALKGNSKDILEYDDLLELKYLSACIYETMRKHPPVPYVDRLCKRTIKLTEDLVVEEGTPVMVNVVGIHYDQRWFPQPHGWRPERMLQVNDNNNLNFTFLPFGDGPRFCIGKRYGMMQIRAALAQLVHKYQLKPAPGPYELQPDPYSILLAPQNGGCVQFIPR